MGDNFVNKDICEKTQEILVEKIKNSQGRAVITEKNIGEKLDTVHQRLTQVDVKIDNIEANLMGRGDEMGIREKFRNIEKKFSEIEEKKKDKKKSIKSVYMLILNYSLRVLLIFLSFYLGERYGDEIREWISQEKKEVQNNTENEIIKDLNDLNFNNKEK